MKYIDNLINKISSDKKYLLLFLIVIAFISCISLVLIPNMSRGHDLAFHLSRISAIKDCIKSGNFGCSIYPNYLNGYGYGNPLFYPDLFLYIPAFFSSLGLSVISSYQIFLFLISFASVLTMYITVKGISGESKPALISSLVYGFSSYRLIDLFTRAALGETLAFVFAPLIIYGIYHIIYKDYKKFYILVIGMTGIIYSHLISTYLIGIILFIICLVNIKKLYSEKIRILYLLFATIITILLCANFIFPMLEQILSGSFGFNNLDQTSHLVERTIPIWALIAELPCFIKPWIPMGIGILFCYFIYLGIKSYKKMDRFNKCIFIISIIMLLCSTKIFPWNLFKGVLSPIQFPWRLYFISTLLLSIVGPILFDNINNKKKDYYKKIVYLVIVALIPVLVVNVNNFFEKNISSVGDYDISYGEYMPSESSKEYINSRGLVITSTNPLEHTFKMNDTDVSINIISNQGDNNIELPLIYYEGYTATVNNSDLKVYKTDNGLVGVNIDNIKNGIVKVSYTGTIIQKMSGYISFMSLLIFIVCLVARRKKHEKE